MARNTNQIHVRMRSIDTDRLDDLAERMGCDSRSELIRRLVVDEADRRGMNVTTAGGE